jgi:hypothetical protein
MSARAGANLLDFDACRAHVDELPRRFFRGPKSAPPTIQQARLDGSHSSDSSYRANTERYFFGVVMESRLAEARCVSSEELPRWPLENDVILDLV